jgi:hypothetical protein
MISARCDETSHSEIYMFCINFKETEADLAEMIGWDEQVPMLLQVFGTKICLKFINNWKTVSRGED